MSYLALARKWRPRNFSELAGQEHVMRALTNALESGRVHHAFLFTGTRGVGKTTIARILAKSLNCETGMTATPCGKCSACREIDEGRFVDLIEVDAASRTKVDDTRELLENVQYAPTRGRYKVYLIDEVHMLSSHSFNALLKTLEEPPPRSVMILVSQSLDRQLPTIRSRSQLIRFQPLSADVLTRLIEEAGHMNDGGSGTPVDTFTESTYPTLVAAERLIDQAVMATVGQIPDSIVEANQTGVRHLNALYAAILIEGSYFREQLTDDQVELYWELYKAGIRGIVNTSASGSGGAAAGGGPGMIDSVVARGVHGDYYELVYGGYPNGG